MKKYRISTTISLKHSAILKRLTEKFDMQQKVLELALESLDNNSRQTHVLSPEEELWMLCGKVDSACLIQKDGYKVLIETVDLERFARYVAAEKPMEYVLEVSCQKPLKDCSLKEVIDGITANARVSKQFDTVDYTDDGDHYTLRMTHNLGLNNSKILKIVHESILKTYGVKNEIHISERSFFIKIFKDK